MKGKEAKRIEFIDSLKGFGIFLVIWGHCIQYLNKNIHFIDNFIYEFIYSFHMPLFFMISGFFFLSSLKLNFKDFLYKKFTQLLLPCIVWSIIYTSIYTLAHIVKGKTIDYEFIVLQTFNPYNWPFWFLKELFISYILIYLAYKLLKKDWLVFLLSIVLVCIIPFFDFQRFLLPLFLVGIYLKKNYLLIKKYSIYLLCISAVLFLTGLFFWKGQYAVYFTGFPSIITLNPLGINLLNIDISIFRLCIGIIGSFFFFILFEKIYTKNKFFFSLEKVGKGTLAIYIMQGFILEKGLSKINLSFPNETIFSLLIAPVLSILILIICIYIIKWIDKNKYIGFYLLGNSLQNPPKVKENVRN